jgi:lipopolysaccharide/colanic/teichoic acid biosynthesis glycosyltransferase
MAESIELNYSYAEGMLERGTRTRNTLDSNKALVNQGQPPSVSDARMMQMLRIFLREDFGARRAEQRTRLLLVAWVVRNKLGKHAKRGLDLLIALCLLPFFVPVMLVTAIAIKLDSPGPVIYRQVRVGKWARHFFCFKFRSMYVNAEVRKAELMAQNEADEIVFKIRNDPRITRVGRIIRKLSIDELPQIINVIKGDMSLVGPRPPVPYEVDQYQYDYFSRLNAVPGITGLQQISGRSDITFKRWVELDLQYIQEQSLRKDIEILLRTIPAVISGRGAY